MSTRSFMPQAKEPSPTGGFRRLVYFFLVLQTLTAAPAWAEAPPPPSSLLLDWTMIDIVAEKRSLAKESLRTTRNLLAETVLAAGKPLSEILAAAKRPPLTINQQTLLGQAQAGAPRPEFRGSGRPWAMEPVWCSVANHDVFMLALIDMPTGRLLAAPHFSIERAEWSKYLASPNLSTQLGERFKDLAKEAIRSVGGPATDAMHLQFDLAQKSTRADVGSGLCLNLMLGAELSRDYQVILPAGAEMWAAARRALAYPATALRPTRRLILTWNLPTTGKFSALAAAKGTFAPSLQLPVTFELVARGAESVFGQSLQKISVATPKSEGPPMEIVSTGESSYRVTVSSKDKVRLSLGGIEAIAGDLKKERDTLLLGDAPQISKVLGGWAYVDKGRAWGLNMDDRLIIGSGKDAIKGHVVGYFGPELKLKSPKGYLIQEGAIIFVRKGQRQARPGMSFAFDGTTFPTAWPPKAEGQLAH